MARVVLTQPQPRVASLAAHLRERGHEVLLLTFSRIVAAGEASAAAQPARHDPVDGTMRRLAAGAYDWVVFVSPAAIATAAARLPDPWPAGTGVAVVGPASRHALDLLGATLVGARVIVPAGPRFDAEALIGLPELRAPSGLRVLVLRGARGNDGWIEHLRRQGASVEVCALYRREPLAPPADTLARLSDWLTATEHGRGAAPVLVVTLVETVQRLERCLAQLMPDTQDARRLAAAHGLPVLTIHPRIAQALGAAGWRDVRLLPPGQQALVAALESA